MSLQTGKRLNVNQWTELPITQEVIDRVNLIGNQDNQPDTPDGPIFEWEPGHPVDTDDVFENILHEDEDPFDTVCDVELLPNDDIEAPNTVHSVPFEQVITTNTTTLHKNKENDNDQTPTACINDIASKNDTIDDGDHTTNIDTINVNEEEMMSHMRLHNDTVDSIEFDFEQDTIVHLPDDPFHNDSTTVPEATEMSSPIQPQQRYNLRSARDRNYARHVGKVDNAHDYTFIQKHKPSSWEVQEKRWSEDIFTQVNQITMAHLTNKHKMKDAQRLAVDVIFNQMTANKGIKLFGEKAIAAILQEYTQLYNMDVFCKSRPFCPHEGTAHQSTASDKPHQREEVWQDQRPHLC